MKQYTIITTKELKATTTKPIRIKATIDVTSRGVSRSIVVEKRGYNGIHPSDAHRIAAKALLNLLNNESEIAGKVEMADGYVFVVEDWV